MVIHPTYGVLGVPTERGDGVHFLARADRGLRGACWHAVGVTPACGPSARHGDLQVDEEAGGRAEHPRGVEDVFVVALKNLVSGLLLARHGDRS